MAYFYNGDPTKDFNLDGPNIKRYETLEDTEDNNEEQEEKQTQKEYGVYNPLFSDVKIELLIEARDKIFEMNPMINRSNEMNNVIGAIISNFYIKNIRNIIIEAPTGSGKSVIGYLTYMISEYIYLKLNGFEPTMMIKLDESDQNSEEKEVLNYVDGNFQTYYLTSSKVLQEQIEYDIKRFGLSIYMGMLKGASNYLCSKETKDKGVDVYYNDRYCFGFSKEEIKGIPCFNTCPYKVQRKIVSSKNVAVLNYAFFLNTTKSEFRPLFKIREMTIADECHLIPDAVLNAFNYTFSQYLLNRVDKVYTDIVFNFGKNLDQNLLDEFATWKAKCFLFYSKQLSHISYVLKYFEDLETLVFFFNKLKMNCQDKYTKPFKDTGLRKESEKILESLLEVLKSKYDIEELSKRPEDIFYESEIIGNNPFTNTKVYKHVVKDMSESTMSRNHFINNTQRCLMMSATVGNADNFAKMMGLEDGEYVSMILDSNFNFINSPIYICNSGKLNYQQYNLNIDKCLMDCIKIAESYHPKDRGIIHTSTNINTKKLQEKLLYQSINFNRYLFYDTSEEKERCIAKMKSNDSIPYVIVGPSLYEGIDLKDDFGRFNILLKVPYSQLNDYAKKKSLRFPFWYERVSIERTVQAIGRTNRNVNDWSKTYLIDSCFSNIIYKCGTEKTITNRLTNLTIR